MIFSSLDFMLFITSILLLLHFIKSNYIKKGLLLLGSYYFYSYWDYRFVLLMFIMSIVNYYIGKKIEESKCFTYKTRWLWSSIFFNLTILGFFKYFNFFMSSANVLLNIFNIKLPLLNIILPIGISFITFEVISYVIDIYRGNCKSAKSFWDLALLVSFFPHLIAGPILKPTDFLPQLDREIEIKWDNIKRGVLIFLLGMIKKIIIADRLSLFVDTVFQYPQDYSSITIWLSVIAYAIQIYCDFSGYTDMAIGVSTCLGFQIPDNFNMPYISQNITEFWRRWHISLSRWLKEYLYISLGGNRRGDLSKYINLLIVMLLGGLWHGASWNFVVWGGLHGVALAIHKLYMKYFEVQHKSFVHVFLNWFITTVFVCIAWVFFRVNDFVTSSIVISKMFYLINPRGIDWYPTSLFIIIIIIIIAHYYSIKIIKNFYVEINTIPGLILLFFVLFGLLFFTPIVSSPFIYFQF